MDDDAQPPFDPATQKLAREHSDDLDAFTRTFRFVAVPLTQAELDANAERAGDNAELAQIRAVYDDHRNGVGTAAQRLTRCERALAWLLRSYARGQMAAPKKQ